MIEAHELTQRYGDTTAVDTLSFTIAPGTVTGRRRAPSRSTASPTGSTVPRSLDWVETIVSCLPLPASSALRTTGAAETQGPYLSAQASLIVMAAYAVVPLAAAAVVPSVRWQRAPVTARR
ncbi:UNVERIFIED_CONTAM: hypothetical protein RF648_05100 [Kocuria sp. CPCC 205274]